MHANRSRRPILLIGIALLGILGLSGCSMIPASWKAAVGQAIEVTAYSDNVAGLYVSNDLAVLGMPVGQVTAVEPQGTG